MAEPTRPIYALVYRQCGHQFAALADWEVAVRVTERCGSVMVREASDADLLQLLPPPEEAAPDRADGIRSLLTPLAKASLFRNRDRGGCWCQLNDAKVTAVWQRLAQAVIDGSDLDAVR